MAQIRQQWTSNTDWLTALKKVVNKKPIVLFRFSEDEWERLRNSKHGTNAFTFTRNHESLNNVSPPTACLLTGNERERDAEMHFGLMESRGAVTTLETRLKITTAQPIEPSSETEILGLVNDNPLKGILRARLESKETVVRLSPAVSVHLIEKLAAPPSNHRILRAVVENLKSPGRYSSNIGLQKDAVALSLKAFGLPVEAMASVLDVPDDQETALAGYSILEDAVIEHDARVIPGFTLSESDLTGRAVFRKDSEILEVITANRRPLEKALGIDLIYLNATKQNIVMVQYKMLERLQTAKQTDWLYRPDSQLKKEISRMKRFSNSHVPGPLEYRINPQVYYLRFVRRDAALGKQAVTMPIDHFETLRNDPGCRGPNGAFRISYDTLGGRYLRQEGFLDLLRSGYIGAYAQEAGDLTNLIRNIIRNGRAVVVAAKQSLNP